MKKIIKTYTEEDELAVELLKIINSKKLKKEQKGKPSLHRISRYGKSKSVVYKYTINKPIILKKFNLIIESNFCIIEETFIYDNDGSTYLRRVQLKELK